MQQVFAERILTAAQSKTAACTYVVECNGQMQMHCDGCGTCTLRYWHKIVSTFPVCQEFGFQSASVGQCTWCN